MPGGDPCTPIAKFYPDGADSDTRDCIDAAYSNYLAGLAGCSGAPACCAAVEHVYRQAWQACVGYPHP